MQTDPQADLLAAIRSAIQSDDYALRPHAVSHMLSEGFGESDILGAIGNGKILERYPDESRCLVVGTYPVSQTTNESLHVVIDCWTVTGTIDWIDIVTAYVPQRPFWETPYQRAKKI